MATRRVAGGSKAAPPVYEARESVPAREYSGSNRRSREDDVEDEGEE
jgi:hypothetical protein